MAAASIKIQKFAVAPEFMPEHLTWFKWEAYGTWIFGFALLVLTYYLNPERLSDRYVGDEYRRGGCGAGGGGVAGDRVVRL